MANTKHKFEWEKDKEKKKAIDILIGQTIIIQSGSAFPSHINIAADYMRQYLGEHSNIYLSFKEIDIRDKTGIELSKELHKANELLQAGAQFISDNGVYKNLQLQLLQLQIRDVKRKWIFAIGGAIGGAVLTNAKDILKYLLSLFHLPPP